MPGQARPLLMHVDDDSGDLQLLREAVADTGAAVEVLSVPSGEAALAYLRQHAAIGDRLRPSLILLDLNLRGQHGLEILERIKAEPALADIATIVFSTSSRQTDRHASQRGGAQGYEVKPASFRELVTLMRALIARYLVPPG